MQSACNCKRVVDFDQVVVGREVSVNMKETGGYRMFKLVLYPAVGDVT